MNHITKSLAATRVFVYSEAEPAYSEESLVCLPSDILQIDRFFPRLDKGHLLFFLPLL